MDSNTHSTQPPQPPEPPQPPVVPEHLAGLAAVIDTLDTTDLDGRTDTVLAEELLALQWLADRLSGQCLRWLAIVDARGVAGADQDVVADSTAAWLRNRLRISPRTACEAVRTARALFFGPLPQTAQALTSGAISPTHAQVLAQGTREVPDPLTRAAEPVLLAAATRMDPPSLRQVVGHLLEVAHPDAARHYRHERRGLWLSQTVDDMVAINGLLEPEAGHTVLTALEPLARPADAGDDRKGGQRNADALAELCRRALEGGSLPKVGGVRPQLLVTVDYTSLAGRPGAVGGDLGWAGPLDPEGCRRLACDGSVTRVLVTRHHPGQDPNGAHPPRPNDDQHSDSDLCGPTELQGRLRAAMVLLPPTLGGAPSLPLDVGRATRVITPAQRSALAVRDRGCVFPGCDRPLAWCEGHHLWHWIDGGPTDLQNLAMVCRAHHRTVHEGGWQLTRGPDGRFRATPDPGDRTRRRHPAA